MMIQDNRDDMNRLGVLSTKLQAILTQQEEGDRQRLKEARADKYYRLPPGKKPPRAPFWQR